MKISIDGIIASARRLNSQRRLDDESGGKSKKNINTDLVDIERKVMSRLNSIQGELKDIQISLTKNQIIDDGINRLVEDYAKGSENRNKILNEVMFEKEKVLHGFIGDNISGDILNVRGNMIKGRISEDISKLKILQVEVENILASNFADFNKVEDLFKGIESNLAKQNINTLDNISQVKSDAVKRLIK